jgi:hypothetical protein
VSVSSPGTNTLLATVAGGAITPAPTFAYQWLRDGSPITGATAATYKLVTADTDKDVNVRVTATRAGYNSLVLPLSTPLDYSIDQDTEPWTWTNVWQVGSVLAIAGQAYKTKDGPLASPTVTYQWLRNGAEIAGATEASYNIAAADYQKFVSVRITTNSPGYLPLVYTTAAAGPMGLGVTTTPAVTVEPGLGLGTLKATISAPTPSYPAPVYSYQWYRDNPLDVAPAAAITGATLSSYKLVAADYLREITVKVKMTRTNFTVPVTPLAVPPEVDYSIRVDAAPVVAGNASPGQTLHVTPPPFYEADGITLVPSPTHTYYWYNGTTLLKTTTVPDLVVPSAYLGKTIRVKVAAAAPGRLARTSIYSASTAPVAPLIVPGTYHPVVTMTNSAMSTMTVAFVGAPTIPASGGFTTTYKWYREGVVSPIATASSYNLVSADDGMAVTVVVTISKSGYAPYVFSALLANGIDQTQPAVITGGVTFGSVLTCEAPTYSLASGDPVVSGTNGTITYQWFRGADSNSAVSIAGETGVNYTVDPADENTNLFCDVTVTAPLHDTLVERTAEHFIPS